VPGVADEGGLPADAGALGARAATPGLLKIGADGETRSFMPGGMGCRGPDSTCPGRGGGNGLAKGGVGRPGAITATGGVGAMRGATGMAG
jgi:hypothetical protein